MAQIATGVTIGAVYNPGEIEEHRCCYPILPTVPTDLLPKWAVPLRELLNKFWEVFAQHDADYRQTTFIEHEIYTTGHPCMCHVRYRRQNWEIKEEKDCRMHQMMREGII